MKREQGFTLVEVIVAILVLTVGLLALVTSAALVTRMIGRGQRSAVQSLFAARRLEMLRSTGCTNQAAGNDMLYRGGVMVDSIYWTFTDRANQTWHIVLRSKYRTELAKWRTDSTETELTCRI
jgi:prepilin-type N-terminal cleavage/methylation domain-containing protein